MREVTKSLNELYIMVSFDCHNYDCSLREGNIHTCLYSMLHNTIQEEG